MHVVHEKLAIVDEHLVHRCCTEVMCRQHCSDGASDSVHRLSAGYTNVTSVEMSFITHAAAKILKNITRFCLQWTPPRGYRPANSSRKADAKTIDT